MDSVIMVCAHKRDMWLENKPYMPIQVGRAIAKVDLGIASDDEGENISNRNRNYCELTAIYWAWKNLPKSVRYVGLSHYRRYFDFAEQGPARAKNKIRASEFAALDHSVPEVEELMKGVDVVMSCPYQVRYPVGIHYCVKHRVSDYLALRGVVAEKYPEYMPAFRKTMRSCEMSLANMFIMRRELFDNYCEWLFGVLFEVERRVEVSKDPFQMRVFGFMAERLMNVWARHNALRVKHLPVWVVVDEKMKKSRTKVGV